MQLRLAKILFKSFFLIQLFWRNTVKIDVLIPYALPYVKCTNYGIKRYEIQATGGAFNVLQLWLVYENTFLDQVITLRRRV